MTTDDPRERNDALPETCTPHEVLGLPSDADDHAVNDAFRARLSELAGQSDDAAAQRRAELARAWESLTGAHDDTPASPRALWLSEDADVRDAYRATRGEFMHWLTLELRDIPEIPRDVERQNDALAVPNLFTYRELNRWIRAEKLRTLTEWDAGIVKLRSTYEIGNVLLANLAHEEREMTYRKRLIEAVKSAFDLSKHIHALDAQRRLDALRWVAQIEAKVAAGAEREASGLSIPLTTDVHHITTEPYALVREVARLSKPLRRASREEAEAFFFAALQDQERSNAEQRLSLVRRV
jgi:hypothetical protein